MAALPEQDRVARHLPFLSVFWIALGALRLVGAGVLYLLPEFLRLIGRGGELNSALHALIYGFSMLLFVLGVASVAAGWGLYKRESWARLLTLILGFLLLPLIPFLTVFGVYTLWVLLPRESEASYNQLAHAV